MMLILIASILTALYMVLMLLYHMGWWLQKTFVKSAVWMPHTKVSVVIAARNEAANIERCIRSILAQEYPPELLEIIVVDDCSEDETLALLHHIEASNLHVFLLSDFLDKEEKVVSFKKKALALGIEKSSGSLVVTTDADCWMAVNWLSTIVSFYESKGSEMIVAPVHFTHDNSLLQLFQSIDFMTMQGITAATVRLHLGIMCNGANLAFSRKAYNAVNGYSGVDHLVSGDDYLLQLKIKKQYPDSIHYLKSRAAIVHTLPQNTWHSFFQQRIRWASKTGKYEDRKMTLILSLIYVFNCLLLFLFLSSLFEAFYWSLLGPILLSKMLIEILFLYPVAHFYRDKKQLLYFVFLQPLHIVYIIVAGFLSRFSRFEWKQRVAIQKH
jgi:cellulose synthase/poly-beta-1,6-N-acetylglucosamine synthase-like glycosyltransferase